MKRFGALLLTTVCLTSLAIAGSKKDIVKEIETTTKDVRAACGCSPTWAFSRKLDFTHAYGSDLAYNVEKAIESAGEGAIKWCQKDADHAAKFCAMVKTVTIDEDRGVESPYTINRGPSVTSYIATKNTKQLMNHGDAWVETFLQSGKMPARN